MKHIGGDGDPYLTPDEWAGFAHRVGRMFFNKCMDTRDIGMRLGFHESAIVRALAIYKADRRAGVTHDLPR